VCYDQSEREEKKRVVYLNIACFLLEHGKADLFIKNNKNETPLDYICLRKKQKNDHCGKTQQVYIDNEANIHLSLFLANYFDYLSKPKSTESQIEKKNIKLQDISNNNNSIGRHERKQSNFNSCRKENVVNVRQFFLL